MTQDLNMTDTYWVLRGKNNQKLVSTVYYSYPVGDRPKYVTPENTYQFLDQVMLFDKEYQALYVINHYQFNELEVVKCKISIELQAE